MYLRAIFSRKKKTTSNHRKEGKTKKSRLVEGKTPPFLIVGSIHLQVNPGPIFQQAMLDYRSGLSIESWLQRFARTFLEDLQ